MNTIRLNTGTTEIKWMIWVNLMIGFWIFILPWAAGPGFKLNVVNVVMWNFLFIGSAIITLSYLSFKHMLSWAYWLIIFTGVWLIVSPWFLFYSSNELLLWNSLVFGLLITSLTAFFVPMKKTDKRSFI